MPRSELRERHRSVGGNREEGRVVDFGIRARWFGLAWTKMLLMRPSCSSCSGMDEESDCELESPCMFTSLGELDAGTGREKKSWGRRKRIYTQRGSMLQCEPWTISCRVNQHPIVLR